MSPLAITLWATLAALAYIYVGYPAAVWLLARLRPLQVNRAPWTGPISVVLVVHNEADRLAAKLDSLLASDIAEQIAEILVGSDGSTDDTAAVLAACPDRRVTLVHFDDRRGKPAVLNDLVPRCRGELVILTDVRQMLDRAAISSLAANFADLRVGVVSGELMFRQSQNNSAAAEGMGAYWTYEKLIRRSESRFRGVPGATGALYGLRRDLFRPVPPNTLLDDVVIPMQAVETRRLCLFEPGAIAWDVPSQSTRQEGIRKRRTIAGCVQLIINQPRWLLPWKNPLWWEFVSHKLSRLVSPLLLAIVLITSLCLRANPVYATLAVAQLVFYTLALLGWWLQREGRKAPLLGPVLMFVALNVTTLLALWDALCGRYRAAWQRAE